MKTFIAHGYTGKIDRKYHAVPTSGLIEGPGGLPLVRDFGLNTKKASNLAGFLVDASGNVTIPGTLNIAGVQQGQLNNVIDSSAATLTLTAAQSGSTIQLDRAAGTTVTLPAPVIGLNYSFLVQTSVTSNNHKVITDAGTTLILGGVVMTEAADTNAGLGALFNGTTHISILMNGTTTGGLIGTAFNMTCVTATQWYIEGIVAGSGTLATCASTS